MLGHWELDIPPYNIANLCAPSEAKQISRPIRLVPFRPSGWNRRRGGALVL